MLLATASEMAELDRKTMEEIGIPGIVLMENAARGAAAFFETVVPDLCTRHLLVLAGSGNNAGDGFALARIFHGKGATVRVVCLRPADRLKGDALVNYNILHRLGIPVYHWDEKEDFASQFVQVQKADVILDALLGTGLQNEVRGLYRDVIEGVNALGKPVLSVDVPSGLHAGTGRVLGSAIQATATATFGCLKVGHVVGDGPARSGRVQVVDIGIPPAVVASSGMARWLLDRDLCASWIGPRPPDAHKGRAGHLCVLSGSPGKTGAAAMVCQGALRVGAGLVTLFVPRSLNPIMEVKLTEAMTLPVAETESQCFSVSARQDILDFVADKEALAAGPGISLHEETQALLKDLVAGSTVPLVLDADALTLLARDPSPLQEASAPVILTPHPGEMARLTGLSVPEVQENRLHVATEFSRTHKVIVVLKGHGTLVAAPDGRLAVNTTGTPAMASGGMGDVLTGMIAGFVAQGLDPFRAACLGVYLHGLAAEEATARATSRGLIAMDLLPRIPDLIGQLERHP
ncbi:NAD(P)H-hydrate epimerase [Desulfacinum hydrothermale DSM 13146]|uniref:Bifunctional NAD(P)H-hydrate repair enzyme n=1 Tax=Desulfacinum hydrothermale DSM 13146 TaxID=1121390 RepID=A0A1W1X1J7_9BACT|nr:NAD(P)H-hydrate dehydratase [Desulfacinum hydrothermale]SMC17839.1 NAD(P)H-hydrate epimerase [Desulfacinum hydrothermale DSM 13146]